MKAARRIAGAWNHLLDDLIAERYWQPRVYPKLFLVFSGLAFVVALVGVYGVVAYASARRAREYGIRLAIGSPPSRVWQLVARQGLHLAVTGTAIGMLAAFGLMRLASTLLFGVSPTDGWVYLSCGTLAVVAVLAASAGPAFRASRIDPVTVLRCQQGRVGPPGTWHRAFTTGGAGRVPCRGRPPRWTSTG